MAINKTLIIIILIVCSFHLSGQGINQGAGGRQCAMGGCGVALEGSFAMVHNPALMAFQPGFSAGLFYENPYMLKGISNNYLYCSTPMAFGGVSGIDVSYFGYSNWQELMVGLAYSRQLGKRLSAGIKINYYHVNQPEGYENRGVPLAEAGIYYGLGRDVWIGVNVMNPNMVRWEKNSDYRLPAVMKMGVLWRISKWALVTAEIEKEVYQDIVIRAGIEYKADERFYIRAGTAVHPNIHTIGFGYKSGVLMADVAAGWHSVFGVIPQLSLSLDLH